MCNWKVKYFNWEQTLVFVKSAWLLWETTKSLGFSILFSLCEANVEKFSFQLSTQVVCRNNVGTKDNDDKNFTDPIICVCEEDFDEDIPPGTDECEPHICIEKKISEWDVDDKVCFCDDEIPSLSSSSSESFSKGEIWTMWYQWITVSFIDTSHGENGNDQ